ncbi:hypothetical protein [Paremcibacter congregatus]|nr:hypothetical protein [Paremcibacter congregatus]
MNNQIKGVLFTVAAIIAAGLLLQYGKDLPLIKDAHEGFGG